MGNEREQAGAVAAPDLVEQWREALEGLYAEFRKRSRAALKDYDEEDVHQARVSARKLLTLLTVLEPDGETGLYRPIKQAQKRFGRVRDADVLIGEFKTLRKEAKQEGRDEEASLFKRMAKLEKEERKDQRKKLSRKLPKIVNGKLDRRWKAFLEKDLPEFAGSADVRGSLRDLKDDYRKRRHFYQVTADREGRYSNEALDALHQVRIAAKRCRYTAEAAEFAIDDKQAEEAEQFKLIQKQLGEVNDRHVRIVIADDYGPEALGADESSWSSFRGRLDEQLREAMAEVGEL
ncbi:CHAD domain-containing protein [Saccharibacillus alkalitolerans]|uniref:CHAD domain-containing protein n=1 Tax=Saccharibacillus alkalitolerans TaxID=2705290 RepID=A0ABX0F7U2_9BACL|nr:CHAD domain-containing protein [Saccharibacillus alkalitolerans]NGZ77031.1 CHAD domain-containing protein [Saccharibacillus alkalitolerans]